MPPPVFPMNRTQWANLDWKQAQIEVANLLKRHGFMVFEEKPLKNHGRTDLHVIRKTQNRIIFGILEVKCHKRISPSIQLRAMAQGCRYLKSIYDSCENEGKWGNRPRQYFVATVFTKDYPGLYGGYSVKDFVDHLPEKIVDEENVILLSSTPDSLISRLQINGLLGGTQTKIDDYFEI